MTETVWIPVSFSAIAGGIRRSAELVEIDYAEAELRLQGLTDAQKARLIFHVPKQEHSTLVGVFAKPPGV